MYPNTTLLAQAPSGVHQPISNVTRPNSNAHYLLLGKRCTTLYHCDFDIPIQHLDGNARPLKKQKLAMHFNTRHMTKYYHNASVSHSSAPIHGSANQLDLFQEPQFDSSIGGAQSKSILEHNPLEMDVSNQDAIEGVHAVNMHLTNNFSTGLDSTIHSDTNIPSDIHASNEAKSTAHIRQRQKHKPYDIFLPKQTKKPSAIHSNYVVRATASTSQTTVNPVNTPQHDPHSCFHSGITRKTVQGEFMQRIQRWIGTLEQIHDAQKEQLWIQLFGGHPTFKFTQVPDLLQLLKEIDQHQHQVTYQEQQATGLMEKITEVQQWQPEPCSDSRERESMEVADRILNYFWQRFVQRSM
ncbi:hypothetical protein OG21DRAFT_979905 [Imleria badia]|nr:hypothetical protein OG21DRAFT_979905 [Imleria badia]